MASSDDLRVKWADAAVLSYIESANGGGATSGGAEPRSRAEERVGDFEPA